MDNGIALSRFARAEAHKRQVARDRATLELIRSLTLDGEEPDCEKLAGIAVLTGVYTEQPKHRRLQRWHITQHFKRIWRMRRYLDSRDAEQTLLCGETLPQPPVH